LGKTSCKKEFTQEKIDEVFFEDSQNRNLKNWNAENYFNAFGLAGFLSLLSTSFSFFFSPGFLPVFSFPWWVH
jgi:hypothetical protein